MFVGLCQFLFTNSPGTKGEGGDPLPLAKVPLPTSHQAVTTVVPIAEAEVLAANRLRVD